MPNGPSKKRPAGASVKYDGKLVTEYHTRSGTKPILWPLIGPTAKPVTRAFPMDEKSPGEPHDHRHQRSCVVHLRRRSTASIFGANRRRRRWQPPRARSAHIEHREFVTLTGRSGRGRD